MNRFRAWWMWTFRDPYDQFRPEWVAEIERLKQLVGNPQA